MRKIYTSIVLFITLSIGAIAQQSHIPGEVMVMVNPRQDVKKVIERLNTEHPGANFRVSQEVTAEWNIWLLSFDNQFISDEAALLMVNRFDGIAMAQYNYSVKTRVVPNDASFAAQQWALNNTGQGGGTVDADIDAPEAWNVTTGGTTAQGDVIVVAVIDVGFQANHPDLVDNYWVNTSEIAGNGIDDDGNGYIDDVNGWNAYNNNGTIPSDNHGTHVAGIVGAKGNNSVGVSGVNWNVKVMRVAGSSGNTATVVSAYAYVAKQRKIYNQTNGAQGAFVVATNASFGVDFGQAANYPVWCAFYDTLGTLGILNAGAGPNTNTNIDVQGDIPTTCPSQYMIAVTNTQRNDTRNSSCGYGPIHMDLGAPGTQIYNTLPTSTYGNLTGTSMATPHVAGAIGLYYAAAGPNFIAYYKSNPSAGAVLMRNYVLTGVDSISSMATTTSSRGRLNLFKGIQRVLAGENDVPSAPPVASFIVSGNSVCAGNSVSFTDQSTNTPTSWAWTFSGGNPSVSTLQNPTVTYDNAGTFHVELTATNSGGSNTYTMSNAITVNANPTAPVIINNAGVFESNYGSGNQWYGPGGIISGATGQTFTPPTNDLYYVVHTDANGCISPQSNLISTVPTPAPEAVFLASDNDICVDDQVVFTDQSTHMPTSWSWVFPGGTPSSSTLQNPTVTYHTAGNYNVVLTATNPSGSNSSTQNTTIKVNAKPTKPTVTNNGGVFGSSYGSGNQWYDAGGMISGANGSTFTPPSNGSYYVIHTNTDGCVSDPSDFVILTASIEELYFEGLNVYPNPIGNQFTVSWESSKTSISAIKIYDSTGRLVYQNETVSGHHIIVQTSQLASGNYKLVLQTNKGDVVKSIVK